MEKEMIQNYAVENAVNVGGKRFLFCISTDENEPHPYMKCRERRETFLAHYENAIAGNDYLQVSFPIIKFPSSQRKPSSRLRKKRRKAKERIVNGYYQQNQSESYHPIDRIGNYHRKGGHGS